MNDYYVIDDLISRYESELNKLKTAVGQLDTDLEIVQTGDDNGSYWNGEVAYNTVKACLGQVEYDYNLIDELTKCLDYLKNKKSD